jgi:hypothetical protein
MDKDFKLTKLFLRQLRMIKSDTSSACDKVNTPFVHNYAVLWV